MTGCKRKLQKAFKAFMLSLPLLLCQCTVTRVSALSSHGERAIREVAGIILNECENAEKPMYIETERVLGRMISALLEFEDNIEFKKQCMQAADVLYTNMNTSVIPQTIVLRAKVAAKRFELSRDTSALEHSYSVVREYAGIFTGGVWGEELLGEFAFYVYLMLAYAGRHDAILDDVSRVLTLNSGCENAPAATDEDWAKAFPSDKWWPRIRRLYQEARQAKAKLEDSKSPGK